MLNAIKHVQTLPETQQQIIQVTYLQKTEAKQKSVSLIQSTCAYHISVVNLHILAWMCYYEMIFPMMIY